MSEKANFSNIYKFYDLINTVLTLGFDKSWREKAANNLIGYTVLDLGSGTGAAFDQLINYETTAIDPDKKMLELNSFQDKVLGSAEDLPFDDNSFEAGAADPPYTEEFARTLYNCDYPKWSVWTKELVRVVKSGGKIAIMHNYIVPKLTGCEFTEIFVALNRIKQYPKIVTIQTKL